MPFPPSLLVNGDGLVNYDLCYAGGRTYSSVLTRLGYRMASYVLLSQDQFDFSSIPCELIKIIYLLCIFQHPFILHNLFFIFNPKKMPNMKLLSNALSSIIAG